MKDECSSKLASKVQGYASTLSYSDGPEKAMLEAVAHCMDTRNVWITGNEVRNARGAKRQATIAERIIWKFFKLVPRSATVGGT